MLALDFFSLSVSLFFEPSCRVTVLFLFLFFLYIQQFMQLLSLQICWREQYSLTFVDKKKEKTKKKQRKDDHGPCYSGEWKQVNILTARFVFIIVCVFCVEALALSNKKEVEGRREREREREREKILPKKKKKKEKKGSKDFFAQEGSYEKDRLQSGHFKVEILSSLAAAV